MPWGSKHLTLEAREVFVAVPVSFESGEQVTGLRVIPPPNVDWRLVGADYAVTKALADTDVGLIDIKDAAGNVAVTQLSLPLSTLINVRGSFVLGTTDARLRAGAGQGNAYHQITVAKTTAGGKAILFLKFRKIAPGSTQT